MRLIPLDTTRRIALAAEWLGDEANYKWLAFGGGAQRIDAVSLKLMTERDIHLIRAYTGDDGRPIGIVALSDIDRRFATASLWFVLGDKACANKGHTRRAAAAMLALGFTALSLEAVHAWSAACNRPSIALLEALNFRQSGRQRHAHVVDGRPYDRLLFDILATEFPEVANARNAG